MVYPTISRVNGVTSSAWMYRTTSRLVSIFHILIIRANHVGGGCQYPLSGNVKGVDCTNIENAEDVLCVAGMCVVQSCTEGFTVVGEKCELV